MAAAQTLLKFDVRDPEGRADVLEVPARGAVWVGRDERCHVVLPSPAVSRRHLSLCCEAGSIVVRDRSSNGTELGGATLRGAARSVGHSATLGVGPYKVRVCIAEPGARTAPRGAAVEQVPGQGGGGRRDARPLGALEDSLAVRRRIRDLLLERMDLVGMDREQMDEATLRPKVRKALEGIVAGEAGLSRQARRELVRELVDEAVGLGPLEPLLADPAVSEVMVVDPTTIYAERDGVLTLTTARFTDDRAVRSAIERIVTPLGRRIDESSPLVDARLADGSRVNAVIPPLALKGPCITIRKFPAERLSMAKLVELGSLSQPMADFLQRAVTVRCNVVISGGTGSGKTTLLNVLSAAIPERERVVTIEDAAELQLAQRHVVTLESRPPNMEGSGAVTIRDLVRNALRMRPDRILVGECRGGEALDMLQAMNTGHDGSMTTTHANSPFEAVHRLETLCLMSGLDLPVSAIRRQIAGSVDLIVQQSRFGDGSRRVTSVAEVVGLTERGEVDLREIFRFDQSGLDAQGRVQGSFRPTGYLPSFVERFVRAGLIEQGRWL